MNGILSKNPLKNAGRQDIVKVIAPIQMGNEKGKAVEALPFMVTCSALVMEQRRRAVKTEIRPTSHHRISSSTPHRFLPTAFSGVRSQADTRFEAAQ